MRYGRSHDHPRDLVIKLALWWRLPRHQQRAQRAPPEAPWYLATGLGSASQALAWYRQRWWIEPSFKDSHSGFGLDKVRVGCPQRLSRLVAALTLALVWLTLAALPEVKALPPTWQAEVAQWGSVSVLSLALALLDHLGDLPSACLPLLA